MHKWRWYEYDVWGNKKDGYEVNQVFRTNEYVDIPDDGLDTQKETVAYLKKVGFLKSSVRSNLFEMDWGGVENTLYITYKGKPIGEFRRE